MPTQQPMQLTSMAYHFHKHNSYQSLSNHSPLKGLIHKVPLSLFPSLKNLMHKVGKLVLKLKKRFSNSILHSMTLPLNKNFNNGTIPQLLEPLLQNCNKFRMNKANRINKWKSGEWNNLSTQFLLQTRYVKHWMIWTISR